MNIKIKNLYEIALAESEGMGTAYEYFVKLRLLDKLFQRKKIKTCLIYGLPEKYGLSLDFFYFCSCYRLKTDVFETRVTKIAQLKSILCNLNMKPPKSIIKGTRKVHLKYDLILSCEYLQMLPKKELINTVGIIQSLSNKAVIFVPNGCNRYHNRYSGLKGLTLEELEVIFKNIKKKGCIDAPPFPPGIKTKKKVKNIFLIQLLEYYAVNERFFPAFLFQNIAHINYVYLEK